MIADVNQILRTYLINNAEIIDFFDPDTPRIYCPRLPEHAKIPAIGIFVRGGASTPYIPQVISPSLQIDCWHDNPIGARSLYIATYSALQGIQNVPVTIETGTYYILSAREEVQGQDLVDETIPNYFRVLTFFEIKIR